MKKEELYEVLGEIDEAYINNARKSSKNSVVLWFSKSTWLKVGSIAACFCLMVLGAVFALNKIYLGPQKDTPEFSYIVTYAGWSEEPIIYEGALNYELIQSEPNTHLPIFRIDTFEELEEFKDMYNNILSLDQGYDTVPSFYEAMSKAQFDREIFYQEHSLLIVYIPANSDSLRFAIEEIKTIDTSICIHIEEKNNSDVLTSDMTGWFICVEANKDKISNYTSFDAVFDEE